MTLFQRTRIHVAAENVCSYSLRESHAPFWPLVTAGRSCIAMQAGKTFTHKNKHLKKSFCMLAPYLIGSWSSYEKLLRSWSSGLWPSVFIFINFVNGWENFRYRRITRSAVLMYPSSDFSYCTFKSKFSSECLKSKLILTVHQLNTDHQLNHFEMKICWSMHIYSITQLLFHPSH